MSKVACSKPWSSQFRSTFQEIEVNPLEEGATALMYACQQENLQQLHSVLKKKPNAIRDRDRTLKTTLHYCAENVSVECAETVLNAAPDILDVADEDGYTTLHLAVIAGNTAMVKFLISKNANINKLDAERHSVIHWATVCGEVELLEILLKSGSELSTPDIHGGYPIHYAAQMCGSSSEIATNSQLGLAALKVLLAWGGNVNVVDHDGRQPLLWAASAGSSDAVLVLTNAGASVRAYDKDGLTALHCSASRGHTECLETLVELCGADVDAIDSNGCTALFYSVTLGHADATQLLLGYGADPNRQDRKGRTPAHCGAAKGQLETLKILNKKAANLWMRNMKGDYPLQDAVGSGRKELVCWLLSLRPDSVNASNSDGRCPIHIAAINNNVELCKILLDYQSLVNPIMKTSKGEMMTPLDAALHKGNRGCAKYLQLHGGVPASKLTSLTAALRGPHRVEAHSDLYATTDHKKDSPSSKSPQSSPHFTYSSYKSRKVEVHIHADVSSETIENNPMEEDKVKDVNTKKYRRKQKSFATTNKNGVKGKTKFKKGTDWKNSESKTINNESYTDESDYKECSTEEGYIKNRRHFRKDKKKKSTENRSRSRSKRLYKMKSFKNEHEFNDWELSDSGNNSETAAKGTQCKREMTSQEAMKDFQKTVTAEVHREDKSANDNVDDEKTSSNGFDPIQYEKLDTDNDTAWDLNFETQTGIPDNEQPQNPEMCKKKSETTNLNDKSETAERKTDIFGDQPFENEIKKEDADSKRPNELLKSELHTNDSNSPSKYINVEKDFNKSGETDSNIRLENNQTADIHVVTNDTNKMMEQLTEGITENKEQTVDLKTDNYSPIRVQDANLIKSEQIVNSETNVIIDEDDQEINKNVDKIIVDAETENNTKVENINIQPENSTEKIGDSLAFDRYATNQSDNFDLVNDKTNYMEKGVVEDNLEYSEEDKGLICVIDDDKNVHITPKESENKGNNLIEVKPKVRSRSVSRKRIHSIQPTRRSKSSFEILSDNENGRSSSHLEVQEDSGFEPSPRYSQTHSEDFTKRSRIPRALNSSIDKRKYKEETDINVTSVTQAVQNNMRKYHLERRIFNTLLELKRLQIRAGKSNEQVSVKRLIDDFQRAGLIVGIQQYDGVYSFKHFEKYLYEQLRTIQNGNKKIIPRIKSSDDFNRLTKALKRTRAGKTLLENVPDNPLFCTHGTHRCIHATHAYTGIPCAAYIAKMDHHQFPKDDMDSYRCFLPRIDIKHCQLKEKQEGNKENSAKSLKNVDPSKPVTLELIHGSEKQTISLPTEQLDKNKRYYVTFTINKDETKNSSAIHSNTKSL